MASLANKGRRPTMGAPKALACGGFPPLSQPDRAANNPIARPATGPFWTTPWKYQCHDFIVGASGARGGGKPLPLPTFFLRDCLLPPRPGGVEAGSRGLGAAIPPDRFKISCTLKGMPDPSRDLSILPPLQGESVVLLSGGIAALNPRLPSGNPPGSEEMRVMRRPHSKALKRSFEGHPQGR